MRKLWKMTATVLAAALGVTGLVACDEKDAKNPENEEPKTLTKAEYKEAFDAVRTEMEKEVSGGAQASAYGFGESKLVLTAAEAADVGYLGIGVAQADLEENEDFLGVLNACVFNYFFSKTLENENFALSGSPVKYAAETAGVATGLVQFSYDGEYLYGSMYMQPQGMSAPGLFTIAIEYDFENDGFLGFEWALRAVGGVGTMYYYHNGTEGYTPKADSASATAVTTYLDGKLTAYQHPTDGAEAFDLVAEWTAVNQYANGLIG